MKVDASAIERNIKRRIKQFKSDNKQMQKVAKIIRNEIVKKSREGEGYDGKPYPTLSTQWMDERDYLEDQVKTHKDYRPNSVNSNITFTGKLLRGIKAVVKGNKIVVSGKGTHKAYSGNKRTKISTILAGLSDRGYKILGVHDSAKARIAKQFRQFLRRRK